MSSVEQRAVATQSDPIALVFTVTLLAAMSPRYVDRQAGSGSVADRPRPPCRRLPGSSCRPTAPVRGSGRSIPVLLLGRGPV